MEQPNFCTSVRLYTAVLNLVAMTSCVQSESLCTSFPLGSMSFKIRSSQWHGYSEGKKLKRSLTILCSRQGYLLKKGLPKKVRSILIQVIRSFVRLGITRYLRSVFAIDQLLNSGRLQFYVLKQELSWQKKTQMLDDAYMMLPWIIPQHVADMVENDNNNSIVLVIL